MNSIHIIDSHQHFWKLDRGDYGWLTKDMGILFQDYFPEDLKPSLEKHAVSGTVLVQAAPTYEETRYLLSLYQKVKWIYGVVGWLDLSSSAFSEQLDSLMKQQGIIGLRPMLQDIEDSAWILQEQVMENLRRLTSYNLPLDLLITERHIPSIEAVLERLPTLRVVIDHIAKPVISKKEFSKWEADMNKLAKNPTICCKLSGFMTLADSWKTADFKPYIHHIVQAFGSSRVMFGSDWPVCLSGGSYQKAIQIVTDNLPNTLSGGEREQIFSINAKTFYLLKERMRKI
ncbi:amidohydrolase 2 [Neobacillus bataviensis LMG 21833]|uniref:Amidohydrolase 2 n=1 Tax=Neobacillus bataviensis LMG 21833 TaxID=1117379 RepID=K6DWN3_9BACI|nr:amidohydrolase family protein [Neobacillus bataviensis]EKN65271.1 amidohydrolase 2 [Neobacillus bataviensis LMG 21833]